MEYNFSSPLLIWIRPEKGQPTVKTICDIDAGLHALNRDGLGNYGLHNSDWYAALDALAHASSRLQLRR